MDCVSVDDGGASVGLNVSNDLSTDSLCLKSSGNLVGPNNNKKCLIMEKSAAHELINGLDLNDQIQKNAPSDISLSTITNQTNEDTAAVTDKLALEPSSEAATESSVSTELSNVEVRDIFEAEHSPSAEAAMQSSVSTKLCSVEEVNDTFESNHSPSLKAATQSSMSKELNSVEEISNEFESKQSSLSETATQSFVSKELSNIEEICNRFESKHSLSSEAATLSFVSGELSKVEKVSDGFHCNESSSSEAAIESFVSNELSSIEVSDRFEPKLSHKAALQSSACDKLRDGKESLVKNKPDPNKSDMCIDNIGDSENLTLKETNVSDNMKTNDKTSAFIEKLAENVSEEKNIDSNSGIDLENCQKKCDVNASVSDCNLKRDTNTVIESAPVKSNVPEIPEDKLNNGILNTVSLPSSETVEVLDESVSEEEVFILIEEADEQVSDISIEKPEESEMESLEENDLKSHSNYSDLSVNLKTDGLVNKSNSNEGIISLNNDFPAKEKIDEDTLKSKSLTETGSLKVKDNGNLEIHHEKDESILQKIDEIVDSVDLITKSALTDSNSKSSDSTNQQSHSKIKENACKNNGVTPETSKNIPNVKPLELNTADDENSLKNTKDMEICENLKSDEPDDFVVLSDIEWSDDDADAPEKQKIKEEQNIKKEAVQNNQECSDEKESQKGTIKEDSAASSDGDDFNLDDVIEEFAKEENKIVKLSDDELDDLVEEFVETECSSPSGEKNKDPEAKDLPSDDEMALLIEDFNAVDSDNDCFIVQDSSNVVILDNDDKDAQLKMKSKSNGSSNTILPSSNLGEKPELDTNKVSTTRSSSVLKKEVMNKQLNTEKNKSAEIFDNKVEENKHHKGNPLFHEGLRKAEISLSSLPLSEKLSGEKVTVECRTDGVFLVQDRNTSLRNTKLHSTGSREKTNVQMINTDSPNPASNNNNELPTNESVKNIDKSDSIVEEQCMDDMLAEVCASNNTAHNDECKSTAVETESKIVNNSIQVVEKQISSENSEMKSSDSLCHANLEESKKRKLDSDNESDESQKKVKTDMSKTDDQTDVALSSTSEIEDSLRKRVWEHFNEVFPAKVRLKKSWLEKLSKRLCRESLLEEYKQEISDQKNLIKDLEEKFQALEDELLYSRSRASQCIDVQQELFRKHHFSPQTAVRTVAVNVKIFRECDVPQPPPLPPVTEVEVPTRTTEIHGNTPVSSTPPIKVQVPQNKLLPVQQTAVPQTATRFLSNPVQPKSIVMTSPQRFISVAPNVTMTKKELPPGVRNTQPTPVRSLLAQKFQPPVKTYGQVIDLTDEESANKKLLPASSTLVSLASNSVPKGNLPALQSNQNVLLPLNGLFQVLPASGQNNPQFSLSNPMQVQQVSRQTLVPTLPTNIIGPRAALAYIIPSNSGQINTIGRNPLSGQNFAPGTNQRLQTVYVRVTNPGQVTPIGSTINSNARMPVLTQNLKTSSVRSPSIPSSASDLVLFPRQPKHPAPFPALPEYRTNPLLKALPPKPSLKGSKAPNGIILSWNMSLINLHAEIANYQLFAYQETSGPVNSSVWKKVGDVKALPLPMACTLTQFVEGNRYYFTVRAVDVHNRFGPYSDAVSILFSDAKDNSKSMNK